MLKLGAGSAVPSFKVMDVVLAANARAAWPSTPGHA